MDGLLVIDKPVGPTSHDVVAVLRRILEQPRVGHTGTLDPTASGVLPLVVGRATRLARFLSGASKAYEAVVRLGYATTTCDAAGDPLGPRHRGPFPERADLERQLDVFRGTFQQQPPAFSAKKIDGRRSYRIARSRARRGSLSAQGEERGLPEPVWVTAQRLTIVSFDHDVVTLHVECSPGFYVRSLAHDLGVGLGVGAHLEALRRTRSGSLSLNDAVPLASIVQEPGLARARLLPIADMLPELPRLRLTPEGVVHALQGRRLQDSDWLGHHGWPIGTILRLASEDGALVALAEAVEDGVLHPSVVLG